MALLETPQFDTGEKATDFKLKNIDDKTYTLDELKGRAGTVIAFICNHCPYVEAVVDRLVETANKLEPLGVKTIAIMPNDTDNYPADSFENMKIFAKKHGFTFPYLIDESQDIAKAYGAVCTPDIFGFDAHLKMVYRGRIDSAGKNPRNADTKAELFEAMSQIANGQDLHQPQHPSMGCSIKWREG
tara:strand:- start:201 stop:758 length:558 start_codon:yes stop_codon:yes gene_type:complete